MTTTTAVKTVDTTAFAVATCATATMTKGAEVDVSTALDGSLKVRLGRTATGALTNPVGFKVEVSGKASGDQFWIPVYVWTNAIIAACAIDQATNLLNGATSAGATTYTLDLATGQNAGDLVFFNESTKYEWARTKSVSGAVATPLDALTFAHVDNTIVTDQGEEWDIPLGIYMPSAKRIRMIVDCAAAGGNAAAASGQTVVVEGVYNLLTSYSTT